MKAKEARAKAIELMARVGIPQPETRVNSYPTSSPAACVSAC